MFQNLIPWVGACAALLTSLSYIPQVQKAWPRGSTSDLSLQMLNGLQDIYYAEQQITKALPKMIDQATNRDLAQGLKTHLEETNKQIERLDQVFKKLGQKPSGTDCPAIDGLIKEADETAGEVDDKSVLDAAIVANAQAVEHYEIARYGTLFARAQGIGHDDTGPLRTPQP